MHIRNIFAANLGKNMIAVHTSREPERSRSGNTVVEGRYIPALQGTVFSLIRRKKEIASAIPRSVPVRSGRFSGHDHEQSGGFTAAYR
jgi:hypothetical protein